MNQDLKDKITYSLEPYGINIQKNKIELLSIFIQELEEWNKKINLVGTTDIDRIINELIIDSLLPLKNMPTHGAVLDIGSGGGFPAIPLKICCDELFFNLVEPLDKRVSFLKQVIRSARLKDIVIIKGRIEEVSSNLILSGYEVVTSRAMAPLAKTIEICGHYVKNGGILICFQGEDAINLIETSRIEAEKNKLQLEEIKPYKLHGLKKYRNLIIFKKINDTIALY